MNVSPKAAAAAIAPLVVALILYAITKDPSVFYLALAAPVSGGAAVAAPPAARVTQEDVAALSEERRDRFGPPGPPPPGPPDPPRPPQHRPVA